MPGRPAGTIGRELARVLARALRGLDGWITGRKRYQGGTRAGLEMFERDPATGLIKVNPLAECGAAERRAYMDRHALPRHPLVAQGDPSIGCAPSPPGSPRRTGWRAPTGAPTITADF